MTPDADLLSRYPHIRFKKNWTLDEQTIHTLGKCEAIVDAICKMPMQPEARTALLRISMVKGAQATTAIEGNTLTQAEIERVVEGESLPPSKEYQEREIKNVLDAMNNIFRLVAKDGYGSLISEAVVRDFHKRIGQELGDHFDAIPGQFRTDERVVGPYRCPRPQDVRPLVHQLCEWLAEEFHFAKDDQSFVETVVQAIVTHVYLEWIHAFGDGNGRTGRLVEFYILLRGGNPDIASHILSNHYNETRAEYYRQIDVANKNRDLTAFLKYAIQGYHDGLVAILDQLGQDSLKTAWRYLIHSRFAERHYRKKSIFKRRRSLALAFPPNTALSLGGMMMLTPELAREYATLTERALARDVAELVAMEILAAQRDGTYKANLALLVPHMAQRRKKKAPTPIAEPPQATTHEPKSGNAAHSSAP